MTVRYEERRKEVEFQDLNPGEVFECINLCIGILLKVQDKLDRINAVSMMTGDMYHISAFEKVYAREDAVLVLSKLGG